MLFQSGILLPNSGEDQEKRSSPHSGFILVRNFGFLVAKWVFLAKKLSRSDVFHLLQCQTRGGAASRLLQNRRLWYHCHLFYTRQVMSLGIFESHRIQMLYSNFELENIVSYSYHFA